jgi:hypothetical protein
MTRRVNKVRETLRANPEGLTVAQITELAGTGGEDKSRIYRIINQMPDAYIDRWIKHGNFVTAVWCVVVPPENCPRPNSQRSRKK